MVAKALVLGQKEVIAKVLTNFINFSNKPRKILVQLQSLNVSKATNMKFKNLVHLMHHHYHYIFKELLEWDAEQLTEKLALMKKEPNFD